MTHARDHVTVLNVDDYEPGRYQRSRVLRSAGFVVLEAGSGGEALELARTARPDLVVLDVNLPDMSGFDVCRTIKSDPDLEGMLVLHLSASSVSPDSKVRGLVGGADSFLAEPIEPDELIANVRALLRLRRAEDDLRRTNVMLQAIVSSSPLAIVAMERDGTVRQWNPAAERMFGWAEGDVLGRRLPIVPQHEQAAFESWVRRAGAGEMPSGLEVTPIRRDGTPVDVSLSLAPLRDEHRRVDGVLALIEDITTRKRIERDVARLFQEAREANRTKDEFLATLSHELRTPLNAMLGWVRLARSGDLPAGRQAHALEVIERNTLAQVRLIEDILDVSRIVSGKLRLRSEPVRLAEVVEAAADAVRPAAATAGVILHVYVEPVSDGQPLTTLGDPQRLQQVIVNLLSNGVKFTRSGGRVDVTMRRVHERAEIAVRDTGAGIDAALLPFVFDRFRQGDSSTARVHGGLGLGLAIAHHLVEAHGGTISAESAGPGNGSTFVVTLPLALAAGAAVAADTHAGRVAMGGLRVLIVEDDADSRQLLEALLSARGAHVLAASSTAKALRVLAAERVDVLVADIGLPRADGFTLLDRVRAMPGLSRLPAVAVTGFASEEDRLRVTAAGYAAHVPKPFDADVLVRTIVQVAQDV
jgi:PAS domain S-box-containing protein